MLIFPAIDLRGGRVVRLTKGDYSRETVYSDSPTEVARSFAEAGATCLHTVDLDGAREGSSVNGGVIGELCGLTVPRDGKSVSMFVETGGGIRSEADAEAALGLGVGRIILGTLAITDFALVKRLVQKYGERIAVGVDARDGLVATHGWLSTSGESSLHFCEKLSNAGVSTMIYTDISRDGTLAGTNLAVYERLCRQRGLNIIASGGVTRESEIAALRDMGAYGVILGKALYAGRLDLRHALAVARGEAAPC